MISPDKSLKPLEEFDLTKIPGRVPEIYEGVRGGKLQMNSLNTITKEFLEKSPEKFLEKIPVRIFWSKLQTNFWTKDILEENSGRFSGVKPLEEFFEQNSVFLVEIPGGVLRRKPRRSSWKKSSKEV